MPRTRESAGTDHGTFDRRWRKRGKARGRRSYDRLDHVRPGTPSVSVVIPTLNEARNLLQVLPRIPEWVLEVLIIDGQSVDDTVKVARAHGGNVRVVLTPAKGKGAAMRVGFQEARGDIIVSLDADGSTDPAEIAGYVGLLVSGADVVLGTRFAVGGGTTDMEAHRRAGNWLLTMLVRLAFGAGFSDLCYGYFAFWRDVLPSLDGPFTGFEVETFIHIRALRAGLRIAEVPSFESPRIWGTSNLQTWSDGMRVLKAIVGEWRRNRIGPQVPAEPAGAGDERRRPETAQRLTIAKDDDPSGERAAQ